MPTSEEFAVCPLLEDEHAYKKIHFVTATKTGDISCLYIAY